MKQLKIDCLALRGWCPYFFDATLHITQFRSHRLIDQSFYEERGHRGFEGQHIEIELLTDITAFRHADKILYHRNAQHRLFVAWPEHIPDVRSAKRIFDAWCAATVYTTETGINFWKPEESDTDADSICRHMTDLCIITDTTIDYDESANAADSSEVGSGIPVAKVERPRLHSVQ